jgi:hypothetical protein
MLWNTASVSAILALVGCVAAQVDGQQSPPSYPSPWMRGGEGWDDAYAKAQAFVSQLTLLEKINLTTGVGWEGEACVGNTGAIPRLGFRGLCLQDSPLGVRDSKFTAISRPDLNCITKKANSGCQFCLSRWRQCGCHVEHPTHEISRECYGNGASWQRR